MTLENRLRRAERLAAAQTKGSGYAVIPLYEGETEETASAFHYAERSQDRGAALTIFLRHFFQKRPQATQ